MGEVIQLQGDQRKDVQEFLVDKKEGLELDAKTIKVIFHVTQSLDLSMLIFDQGPRLLRPLTLAYFASFVSLGQLAVSVAKGAIPVLLSAARS